MSAINGSAIERLARVMTLRQRQFATRVVVASVIAGIFFGFTGWLFASIWFAAYVGLQLVERALFEDVDVASLLTSTGRYRQALLLLAANTLLFGAFGLAEALKGGPWGVACACLLWGGSVMNSVVTSNGSRDAFAWQAAPSAFFYLAAPAFTSAAGAPWIDSGAIIVAGALNFMIGVTVWGASQKLFDAEHAARLKLERKKREAEAATEAKSAFVAMVSHELRTPISAILAGAGEIERLAGDAAARSNALLIKDSARMMRTLLNDLLDLSKIEAGRMSVETIPFDLRGLILDTVRFWSAETRKKGLRLRLSGAAGVPQFALGDPTRLRQILNNLISNALKFTAEGSVTLAIAVRRTGAFAVEAEFSVVDTGPGMTPEQIGRLFRAFEQLGAATARTHGGTGLGLAISRDLAELMGGRLTVTSTPGRGANFTLSIPLEVTSAPAASELVSLGRPQGERRLSVLVADDHEVNRRAFSLMLSALEVEVTTAENGLRALELLEAVPFDLVLMDVHMPVLGGIETVRRLRAGASVNRRAPVIALTAASGAEDLALCLASGMDAFVTKPVDGAELFAAIDEVLRPPVEIQTALA
jgi:signal transduction histidine kinase/ActR/RegA family two-component response regulator